MPDGFLDLSGKVAFIPGGYGGIGAALAAGLARQGASVATGGDCPTLRRLAPYEGSVLRTGKAGRPGARTGPHPNRERYG